MQKNIHVIINPASGNNEPILNTLNEVWHAHDVRWQVSITQQLGDGARFAREAIENGAELIVAYGGDGTLRDVASGMIGHDVPLAILPGGTGNALADDLGIPPGLAEAAALVIADAPHERAMDVGQVGEAYFLLRVGTGLIADYSSQISREMKDRWGVLAYYIGALNVLSDIKSQPYVLTLDGEQIETEGITCVVMNTSVAGGNGGLRLSPRVKVDDGLLDVFMLTGQWRALLDVARSMADMNMEAPDAALKHWQAREIRIHKPDALALYADGESMPSAETPITLRVLPGALRIRVPQPTNTADNSAQG